MPLCLHRFLRLDHHRLLQTRAATDALLRANEHSIIFGESDQPSDNPNHPNPLHQQQAIARIDVSQLAANKPVEDFFSASKCLASDAYLLGVFDGHAGAACARHVSTRLYDYLCAAVLQKHRLPGTGTATKTGPERLQWLLSQAAPDLIQSTDEVHAANIARFAKRFRGDPDVVTVRRAIQEAFAAMDQDLSDGAMPDSQGQVDKMSVNVASSGSCALVSHIRRNHLHVANVGDSAAVLGIAHQQNVVGRKLSRSHSVENLDEISRIKMAHPVSENHTILKGGRLLGELYPLRAFGDVRYKWPVRLQRVVLEPLGVPPPGNLFTPPYLTATPEVFYHQLTPNDRFLVIASDGLWELLDPDTVVRLIYDHTLGAQTLGQFEPSAGQSLSGILKSLEDRQVADGKKPLDENSATHVIRNALGGCSGGVDKQYERLRESLQLPPGMARHYRDDITIMVIHFNEKFISQLQKEREPIATSIEGSEVLKGL